MRPTIRLYEKPIAELDEAAAARSSERLPEARPAWDGEKRELRYRGLLVKQFRQPAGNQVPVLEAFERAGWPTVIHNPFGGADCPKAREALHAAIQNLNRRQQHRLLRRHRQGGMLGGRLDRVAPSAGQEQEEGLQARHPVCQDEAAEAKMTQSGA